MASLQYPAHLSPLNSSDNAEGFTDCSMSRCSREPIELELAELPGTISDSSYSLNLVGEKAEKAHPSHPGASEGTGEHGRARSIVRKIWLTVFLPAVAFAYLSFCYVAAMRLVPVRIWMVDQPAEHLYGIKAGVTTINIIVVAIALLPLKSLLDDIKASGEWLSEEFFRTLHQSPSGVPLGDINSISIPSNTFTRAVRAILQNRASKYYAGAILSGITAALISSLAPAALSVGLVSADSEVVAIEVGAIGKDSVYRFRPGISSTMVNRVFDNMVGEAATMGWVQNVLGAELAFTPNSLRYGVPVPLGIDPTALARYLTDVIVIDPICNWTIPGSPPVVTSDPLSPQVIIDLPNFGLQIKMSELGFQNSLQQLKSLDVVCDDTLLSLMYLLNSTTLDPITDGTMAWIISQCTSCSTDDIRADPSLLDLSGVPTQEYSFSDSDANTTTSNTAKYSVLVCNPRISIETREVVLDGTGKLEVLEGVGLVSQGNLHPLQTRLLTGNALLKFASDSGPESTFSEIGRAAQVKMFFGSSLGNSTTTLVLKPQSIEEITKEYGLALQAAFRSYLSGALGRAYVPGRVQVTKLVFTSSTPHIIVSTILFTLVALFINICYLRSDMEQFTLFSVATALARSNVGAICEDAKATACSQKANAPAGSALGLVEGKRLFLTNNGSGSSLHME